MTPLDQIRAGAARIRGELAALDDEERRLRDRLAEIAAERSEGRAVLAMCEGELRVVETRNQTRGK